MFAKARHSLIIPVEDRVAVTLWRLASNADYQSGAELFSLGRSTVCNIFLECCTVIAKKLLPQFMNIPTGAKLREIVDGFQSLGGFHRRLGPLMAHTSQ